MLTDPIHKQPSVALLKSGVWAELTTDSKWITARLRANKNYSYHQDSLRHRSSSPKGKRYAY